MAGPANQALTTAQLAERTGLEAGTLRMWERRHGFPEPRRLAGGHRRYAEADVQLVRAVLALRDQGLSLPAAIAQARGRDRPAVESVFAGLRRRRPDVAPTLLPKRAVLALSRAIEDEYCARAGGGIVAGAFQRERFYRASQRRWRELARTAELAVALADFAAAAAPPGDPLELPLGPRDPLAREWTVLVCAGPVQACLSAWERPTPAPVPDARRPFEVLWSFDPEVVADAAGVLAELLEGAHPDVAARLAAARAQPLSAAPEDALGAGGALAQRMVGYLGQELGTPPRPA